MKKSKILIPLLALASLLLATLPGHAAGMSDSTTTTVEPILVKADAQVGLTGTPFRTNQYPEADIRSFDLSTSNNAAVCTAAAAGTTAPCIIASITTAAPVPQTPAQAATMAPPYGGVHIMVHFQTDNMESPTGIGCALPKDPPSPAGSCPFPPAIGQANAPVVWTPMFALDRQFLALGYGVVLNEEDNDSWVARYDPTGRVAGAVPAGQVWTIQAQRSVSSPSSPNAARCLPDSGGSTDRGTLPADRGNSTNVSFSGSILKVTTPYLYQFRSAPPAPTGCLKRSKQLVDSGELLKNAVAFSWLDHEIGGPEPVGLILGWTWYTDSIPGVLGAPKDNVAGGWSALADNWGYKMGTPSGDPNVAAVENPTSPCARYQRGIQVTPLPPTPPGPCMTINPIGPGFNTSGINVTAA